MLGIPRSSEASVGRPLTNDRSAVGLSMGDVGNRLLMTGRSNTTGYLANSDNCYLRHVPYIENSAITKRGDSTTPDESFKFLILMIGKTPGCV